MVDKRHEKWSGSARFEVAGLCCSTTLVRDREWVPCGYWIGV